MEDCIDKLVRGDGSVLGEVSPKLAHCFGEHIDYAPGDEDFVISQRIIQQYAVHQDIFDRAMELPRPMAALSRAAIDLGYLPSVFVYGISPYMAQAFRVGPNKVGELADLISAGDIEPEVIAALQRLTGRTRLSAANLDARRTSSQGHFDYPKSLCRHLLSNEHGYALLLAGVDPFLIRGITGTAEVMACITLGVDPTYAVQTRGRIDPREVAKAYREGIAIDYLLV